MVSPFERRKCQGARHWGLSRQGTGAALGRPSRIRGRRRAAGLGFGMAKAPGLVFKRGETTSCVGGFIRCFLDRWLPLSQERGRTRSDVLRALCVFVYARGQARGEGELPTGCWLRRRQAGECIVVCGVWCVACGVWCVWRVSVLARKRSVCGSAFRAAGWHSAGQASARRAIRGECCASVVAHRRAGTRAWGWAAATAGGCPRAAFT